MNNECLFHPGEVEGDCPLCNELTSTLNNFDDSDAMKWASLIGFILDHKDKGKNHFKMHVSQGSKDIITIENGDESIEIEIS